MAKTPTESDYAQDALELLVNQFSDPVSFVRELVQNSIDAGSTEIDVWCELRKDSAAGDDRGTMIIRVEDYGEGMDRAIIDTKLTRLFSSDKTDDLTKIGKFGIGFVSVFAIKPDAVCLDTGRLGESWRVVFRKDRSFTRIRLREPIEGTKIQVIKAVSRSEYVELEERVGKALRFHCRHVDITLRYGGEQVSEPLDLDALFKVADSDGTTSVVVGITRPGQPEVAGFYNRGLTLLEEKSPLQRVTFKVNSPYLEHTLSRDNVIRDENYQQTMALVERVLKGPLLNALLQALDAALRRPDDRDTAEVYVAALAALTREGMSPPKESAALAVASAADGTLYSFLDLERAAQKDQLVHTDATSALSTALAEQGGAAVVPWQAVLIAAIYDVAASRRRPTGKESLGVEPETILAPDAEVLQSYRIERRFVLPLAFAAPDDDAARHGTRLCSTTLALLVEQGTQCQSVTLGHLRYPGSGAGERLAITQPQPLKISRLDAQLAKNLQGALVLNADHETVQELLPLCETEPELAAYTLLKHCYLGTMTERIDSTLFSAALEGRWQRLPT